MSNLGSRKGFRPMNWDQKNSRPELRVFDVPDNPKPGTTSWHINNLCRVMDYLGVGSIEYIYVKTLLEERLQEHEAEQTDKG